MDPLKQFSIPLRGLKDGPHEYHFELDRAFFDHFESKIDPSAGFQIKLTLDKRQDLSQLTVEVKAVYQVPCDRCLADLKIPISEQFYLILKNGEGESDDPDLLLVPTEAKEINLASTIFDFVSLSIPLSNRIEGCEELEPAPCDPEVLNKIQFASEPEANPVWDELKKLK